MLQASGIIKAYPATYPSPAARCPAGKG